MSNKRKVNILYYLSLLVLIVGLALLLYPTGSDLWNRYRNQQLTADYTQAVFEKDDTEINRLWDEAVEFNKQHRVNDVVDAFTESSDYELSHPYDELLNLDGKNIMGYIEIPKINVRLSVGHGVGEETLLTMAGHLEGTSLPIGGESTHSVISAHRALPSAKLFTDLDQMVVGDKFYYNVLNKVIAYEVDRIDTVLPDEMSYLDIVKGEDYSTLLTCTPYGINTHRLLVRGKRIPYEEEVDDAIREITFTDQVVGLDIKVKILIGSILFILVFSIIKRIVDKRRKRHQV